MDEALSLDRGLTTDAMFELRAEPERKTSAYQLRVHTANWPRRGEGIFRSPAALIEATLAPAQDVRASYVGGTRQYGFPVGQIIFVPPGQGVHCRFAGGIRRTVSCLFDIAALGVSGSPAWDWSRIDPSRAFDVRNPFVQVAVQRLIQEASSPSIAGDIQIEAALIFLASELQRHFQDAVADQDGRCDMLDARQLALIRAYIEDQTGPFPTLRELANLIGMSAQGLTIKYRNATGQTMRSYMSDAKLIRAKRLLTQGDEVLMKQVAHLSGFGCAATFAVAFRRDLRGRLSPRHQPYAH
jgi:AraC family transcriptional regulator